MFSFSTMCGRSRDFSHKLMCWLMYTNYPQARLDFSCFRGESQVMESHVMYSTKNRRMSCWLQRLLPRPGFFIIQLCLFLSVLSVLEHESNSLTHERVPSSALGKGAVIHTTLGDITVRLYGDECPKTVENFCTHAKNNYYNGIIFHRVIKSFMLQTGAHKCLTSLLEFQCMQLCSSSLIDHRAVELRHRRNRRPTGRRHRWHVHMGRGIRG